MKTKLDVRSRSWRVIRWSGIPLLLVAPLLAFAQHTIHWSTIDGGGGTSTGGSYSLSGTIGQPDAGGPMTGGDYALTGGFWALQAVQVPGAPLLSIAPAAPGQATISWTPDPGGWVLQETPGFSPTNWVNSASGPTNPITIPTASEMRFYRLHKP